MKTKAASNGRRAITERLEKTRTGIAGLDEITGGGLPKGRPTLVCGGAGCGKTIFAIEFAVRGATQFDEPGVFMTFEETEGELAANVASMGFDVKSLEARKKLIVDFVRIERSEIEETGEFDLEGLFVRLGHAIDSIGARRVVLDTIEVLFASLPNEAILRAELRRLFRWLKDKGVTAVITAERGREAFTRHGLEEYVADCVVLLDHRVNEQISTRRLRIVKYRGSRHGTNEYPFLISDDGISVMPITSLELSHAAPEQRVSSGVPRLDTMLGARGYYRGSSVLISGTAGTGKTSLAAAFVAAAAARGERCLYFAFEESVTQITRNMRSIGIDLEKWTKAGLIQFHAARPSAFGLEMHLLTIQDMVRRWKPRNVILDPVTNLIKAGSQMDVQSMLTRLIDQLKDLQITSLFTSLTAGGEMTHESDVGISSLMDAWLLVRNVESNGERNRCLYVLKSRGMPHSNQIREFILSRQGIQLVDVQVEDDVVLVGSARLAREARGRADALAQKQHHERQQREFDLERKALEAQIAALQAGLAAKMRESRLELSQDTMRSRASAAARSAMGRNRMADVTRFSVTKQKPSTNGMDK